MAGVFGSIGKNLLKGLLTGAAGYAGNKIIKRFTGGRIRRGRRRRRTRRYSGRAKLLRRLIMRRMRRRGRFRRRRRRGGFLMPPLRHGGMIGRGLTDDDASSSKNAPRRKLHKLIEGYGAQAYEVPIADNIDHNINYPRSSLTYPANRREEKNLLLGTAIAEMTGKGETSSVSFTPNTIGSRQYNSKKRSTDPNEASSSALDEDVKNVAKSYSLRDMREIDKPFKNVKTPLTLQKLNAALPHVINNKDNKKLSFPEKNDLVVNFVRGSLAHNKKLMSADTGNSDPQPEIQEPMIEDDAPSFTFSSAFDGSGRNSTMPLEMTGGAVTRGQTGRKRVHFNMNGSIKRPSLAAAATALSSSSAAAPSSPWRTHPMIIIRGKRMGLSQTGALRPKGPLKDYHVSSVLNTKRARRGRPHKYMRRGKSRSKYAYYGGGINLNSLADIDLDEVNNHPAVKQVTKLMNTAPAVTTSHVDKIPDSIITPDVKRFFQHAAIRQGTKPIVGQAKQDLINGITSFADLENTKDAVYNTVKNQVKEHAGEMLNNAKSHIAKNAKEAIAKHGTKMISSALNGLMKK